MGIYDDYHKKSLAVGGCFLGCVLAAVIGTCMVTAVALCLIGQTAAGVVVIILGLFSPFILQAIGNKR